MPKAETGEGARNPAGICQSPSQLCWNENTLCKMFQSRWTSKFQWSRAVISYFEGMDCDKGGPFLHSFEKKKIVIREVSWIALFRPATNAGIVTNSPGHFQVWILESHKQIQLPPASQTPICSPTFSIEDILILVFGCSTSLGVTLASAANQTRSSSASLLWHFLPGSHPIAETPFICATLREQLFSNLALKRKIISN